MTLPRTCRLGPALRIVRTVSLPRWPEAIAAIEDPDERDWADAWLREQAQILRMRRRMQRNHPAGRVDRDQHTRALRERR